MTNSGQLTENDTRLSLIEQLGEAVKALEALKDASEDRVQWVEIEQHFRSLDMVFKKRFKELEAREKEYEEEEAKTSALLAEREAEVVAMEQDMLDRVQELKDAAVTAIAEAHAAERSLADVVVNKDSKVSSSLGDQNSPEENLTHKISESTEGVAADVKPRPELTQLCEQMDAKGLLSYTLENQKNLYAIRKELSVALQSASEPARLVLDSLEGFYPLVETTLTVDRRDAALQGKRKSCVMFMEALASFMEKIDPGGDHLLNPEIKQQAKAIADEWKPKLARVDFDATNGNSLEADSFLQLLATFRISSEFDEEELCKLVLVVAHRRQAPALCRSLGLTHKMAGVVDALVNSGKQIDAVRFIHVFQLTESHPPVPLLKRYLDDIRRNSQGNSGDLIAAAGAQANTNADELAALKAVIRCVEEYKLEADYPLDPLKERVSQLEKLKNENKRHGDFGKHHQQKKARANRGYRGRGRGGASALGIRQTPPVFAERTAYSGIPERYPLATHASLNLYNYQAPSQPVYGQQATDPRLHYYNPDDRTTGAAYDVPPSYSGYVDRGIRPSYQPYM